MFLGVVFHTVGDYTERCWTLFGPDGANSSFILSSPRSNLFNRFLQSSPKKASLLIKQSANTVIVVIDLIFKCQ